MELIKVSLIFIQREDGKILAVSRKDNHSDMGLPGGKVEENESFEEAAIREMKEETGLTIYNLIFIKRSFYKNYDISVFSADFFGEIYSEEKHIIDWINPEILLRSTAGDYFQEFFQQIGI